MGKITKIKAKINEIQTSNTKYQWNENLILWKDKPLPKLIKRNRKTTQVNNISNENRDITIATKEM